MKVVAVRQPFQAPAGDRAPGLIRSLSPTLLLLLPFQQMYVVILSFKTFFNIACIPQALRKSQNVPFMHAEPASFHQSLFLTCCITLHLALQ